MNHKAAVLGANHTASPTAFLRRILKIVCEFACECRSVIAFQTAKEQTIGKTCEGKVDILIGTHN